MGAVDHYSSLTANSLTTVYRPRQDEYPQQEVFLMNFSQCNGLGDTLDTDDFDDIPNISDKFLSIVESICIGGYK